MNASVYTSICHGNGFDCRGIDIGLLICALVTFESRWLTAAKSTLIRLFMNDVHKINQLCSSKLLLSSLYKEPILKHACFCARFSRMKVVNLKQAILQAWKERWSDYQWAINIKRNFPKGATWDYLNLAGKHEESPKPSCTLLNVVSNSCDCCGFDVCRGPDGASNDWSFAKPTYFVLPQIRHKLPGEKERCRNNALNEY